jgi:hypothetical protein
MTALGMVLEERGFLVAREVIIDIPFHGRRIILGSAPLSAVSGVFAVWQVCGYAPPAHH